MSDPELNIMGCHPEASGPALKETTKFPYIPVWSRVAESSPSRENPNPFLCYAISAEAISPFLLGRATLSIPSDELIQNLEHMESLDLKGPFWVVYDRIQPGIYDSWGEAALQLNAYPGVPTKRLRRSLTHLTASQRAVQ